MNTEPVGRFQWSDLPTEAQQAVTERFGKVLQAETSPPGLTVGIASRLRTETGDVFLKAIPARSPAVGHYWREHEVGQVLPAVIPAPRLAWSARMSGWLMLVFDHIPGREAELGPGSSDIPRVLDTLVALGDNLGPCPWRLAPDITVRLSAMMSTAREALNEPPDDLGDVVMFADAFHSFDLDATRGDTLLHGDVHAGNLHVTPGYQIVLLDWSLAARGAPWLDLARLVPRLIAAGHTPTQAETVASRLPVWDEAPADAVTGLAALWTLFASHMAGHGPRRLREHRQRSMEAGIAWVRHRSPRR